MRAAAGVSDLEEMGLGGAGGRRHRVSIRCGRGSQAELRYLKECLLPHPPHPQCARISPLYYRVPQSSQPAQWVKVHATKPDDLISVSKPDDLMTVSSTCMIRRENWLPASYPWISTHSHTDTVKIMQENRRVPLVFIFKKSCNAQSPS